MGLLFVDFTLAICQSNVIINHSLVYLLTVALNPVLGHHPLLVIMNLMILTSATGDLEAVIILDIAGVL